MHRGLRPFPTLSQKFLFFFAAVVLTGTAALLGLAASAQKRGAVATAAPETETPGALLVVGRDGRTRGACPLKHTDVHAELTGFLSRVIVTQEFENPFKEKIEAVYTFPLPQAAAVDDMTMKVGDRTVRGRILRREQAQAVYEAARSAGQVASLLDQERPNIFTQSIANIMPGERVTVTISYVETLKYEDGTYEFSFPMVVGPRYIPGAASTQQTGGGTMPNTDRVPDASRITPPLARKGGRAGHDISLDVTLDAGVPLDSFKSTSHEVDVEKTGPSSARVRLKNLSEIPNKDFILRYDVASRRIEDAVLTHRSERGGYFSLILQPPDRVAAEDVTPKELVFVLDTSGSMSGFPIEKAKEAMKHALDGLYPQDTFNLITFAGDTRLLFPAPVSATKENLQKAQTFLALNAGSGGTEMMEAIRAALEPSDAQDHVRIVCFMTDGYVGNDMEIISEVQKHPNARVFSFGIGSSVNHFLLDKMAEQGRGEVEYVGLDDDGSAAARRFHERVRSPLLTDISIDWAGLPVADVYPRRIPDLFSAKPVVLTGRYTGGARGVVRLRGRMAGNNFEREIAVNFPEAQAEHDVLATLWARRRVDDLMNEDYAGIQRGNMREDVREAVTQLGLEYRLMTQFTSFVAVEEMTVTDGGQPRRIEVPIEAPEGMRHPGEAEEVALPLVFAKQSGGVLHTSPMARRSRPRTGAAGRGSASMNNAPPPPAPTPGARSVRLSEVPLHAPIAKDSNRSGETRKMQEQQGPLAKLHPSIASLVERVKNKRAQAGADEAKFVRDGKAEIQVWLFDKTPEALLQLKRLGFEVVLDPKTSKLVIGRLSIEKLEALAQLKVVRFVSPQT